MKKKILFVSSLILLVFLNAFAQEPTVGSAINFAVFTSVGAFNNNGGTHITGDIGTGAGLLSGFPPGTISGQMHVADASAVSAATDVNLAYADLVARTCVTPLAVGLGNGQTITPGIYCIGAAATLNGNLLLDALGVSTSVFIIKIDGALATGISSHVVMVNGASPNHIYWQVNGRFDAGANSLFQGTLISSGAINLADAAAVNGRMLSTAGAITLTNNVIALPFSLLAVSGINLSAEKQANTAIVSWYTPKSESNVSVFIERSNDGTIWKPISAPSTQGNTAAAKNYIWVDPQPLKGLNYYRAKMTAQDGIVMYSNVASLLFDLTRTQITVFPNPVKADITVTGLTAGSTIIVTDIVGKTVREKECGSTTIQTINTAGLAPGSYVVKVTNPTGLSTATVITKE